MQIGTFYQTLTSGWGKWEARMYSLKKKKSQIILFIILVTLLFRTRNVKQFFVHFCIPENICSPHINRNKAEVTLRYDCILHTPFKRAP